MRCLYPIQLGKKLVPCGKCNFCLQVKRADWSFRLLQELKVCRTASFLTLTYADEHIPVCDQDGVAFEKPSLLKYDLQCFFKRLRKESEPERLRYYSVGEYGTETDRPHYHSIMFNLPGELFKSADKLEASLWLTRIWQKGNVHVGDVSFASIHYVTKYVVEKGGTYAGREPPFSVMSRRPGIGSNYLETHTKWHRDAMRNYTKVNGVMSRLPRYFKDKMFTEEERVELALQSEQMSKEAVLMEFERLKKFSDDPYRYYAEAVRADHDRIRSKVSQFNKF